MAGAVTHRPAKVGQHCLTPESAAGAFTNSATMLLYVISLTSLVSAKRLGDVKSVLIGVWMLVASRFQPSPLDSNIDCSIASRKAECVSLSLPVQSLSIASLLVVAGVTGYREAPTQNLQGRHLWYLPVEQTQGEKTPKVRESGRGRTRHMCPNRGLGGRRENSQRL